MRHRRCDRRRATAEKAKGRTVVYDPIPCPDEFINMAGAVGEKTSEVTPAAGVLPCRALVIAGRRGSRDGQRRAPGREIDIIFRLCSKAGACRKRRCPCLERTINGVVNASAVDLDLRRR